MALLQERVEQDERLQEQGSSGLTAWSFTHEVTSATSDPARTSTMI